MAMQNGGWYGGQQFWNGVLGKVGQIINPNQIGHALGGGAAQGAQHVASMFNQPPPPPPPLPQQQKKPGVNQPVSMVPNQSKSQPTIPSAHQTYVTGTPEWAKPAISRASTQYNVPTAVLSGVIKQESHFNTKAVSSSGAIGLAQFMPDTAKALGINPNDPMQAIEGAAKYLKSNFDAFGSWEKSLAAYNAGPNAVAKYGGVPPFSETKNYVNSIMKDVSSVTNPSTPSSTPNAYQLTHESDSEIDPQIAKDEAGFAANEKTLKTLNDQTKSIDAVEKQYNEKMDQPIDPNSPLTMRQFMSYLMNRPPSQGGQTPTWVSGGLTGEEKQLASAQPKESDYVKEATDYLQGKGSLPAWAKGTALEKYGQTQEQQPSTVPSVLGGPQEKQRKKKQTETGVSVYA